MGGKHSKTVVTNNVQTPELKSFKQIEYSKIDKGYREKFKDISKETSRMIKTENIQKHSNE